MNPASMSTLSRLTALARTPAARISRCIFSTPPAVAWRGVSWPITAALVTGDPSDQYPAFAHTFTPLPSLFSLKIGM